MEKMAIVNGKVVPPDLMEKIKAINSKPNVMRRYSVASSSRKFSVSIPLKDMESKTISEDKMSSEDISMISRNVNMISENETVISGNEKVISEKGRLNTIDKDGRLKGGKVAKDAPGSIFDLIKYPGLRKKFLILTLGWTACIAVYGGLTLSFENFHGNEFVNWFLLSVVEFPSNWISWVMMETRYVVYSIIRYIANMCYIAHDTMHTYFHCRLGRRWTHSSTMILGGLSLCMPMFLPSSYSHSIIIASMMGKCLCNVAFNVVYQQTAELLPTPVRNSGLSYGSAIASAANFALPYLAALVSITLPYFWY